MKLQVKTLAVLRYIKRHRPSGQKLEKHFGESVRLRLQELQIAKAINYEFEADGLTHSVVLSAEGLYMLENYVAEQMLAKKEKWKERIYGFIFGVLTSVAASFIIKAATEHIARTGTP